MVLMKKFQQRILNVYIYFNKIDHQQSWNAIIFCFLGFANSFLKYKKNFLLEKKYKRFSSMGQKSFISQKKFHFPNLFIVWKVPSWNIREFFLRKNIINLSRVYFYFFIFWACKFYFPIYKKNFFWENIGNCFGVGSFYFLRLGCKVTEVTLKFTTCIEQYMC